MTKRRSPAFTRWLSTTWSSTMGPLTWGAMPTTLARTAASSVRGCTSVSRQVNTLTTSALTTMAMPTTRPTRGRGNRREAGSGAGPAAGVGSLTLGPVEDEPGEHRQEEPQARIDQDERAQMRLEPAHGEDDAHRHADDPGRKERSLDVDGGITAGDGDTRDGDERTAQPPASSRDQRRDHDERA